MRESAHMTAYAYFCRGFLGEEEDQEVAHSAVFSGIPTTERHWWASLPVKIARVTLHEDQGHIRLLEGKQAVSFLGE